MRATQPQLSIVIVNWNAGNQLVELIFSIILYHHGLVESVIVIDNNSVDESLTPVEALDNLPFQLHVIRNNENIGFGAACNQGALISSSKYILFLNPDTLLFENSLLKPYQFMTNEENNKIGIVGVQLLDVENRVTKSCSRFPSPLIFLVHALGLNRFSWLERLSQPMLEWDHLNTQLVDQVMGAFFFVRRSVYDLMSGFDEIFYVYFEEVDFSLRAKRKGWNTAFISCAQAFHRGGGVSRQVKAHRLFYSLRSRIMYASKHFSPFGLYLTVGTTFFIEPITRVVQGLISGSRKDISHTLHAYSMLYLYFLNIIKKNFMLRGL